MAESPAPPAYRLDVQGLRAVAVLLVFFAHAGWPPFTGGFIGVDVFFVISGYVITRYLLREYSRQGELRLRNFYARRLQRLLPALLLMVLVVSLVATALLPRQERAIHLDAAANALFWISNLFFYFTRLDYFDSSVNENLFLHTWTLGVEEQFYLVWPLVLLAGLTVGARRGLPVLLACVTVATLALCLYWARTDPQAAFYMMPARGWQFAAGGLVAWWHQGGSQAGSTVARIASPVGLALVAAAAVLLDENSDYPNLNALAPTLGAALVLVGGGWCNRLLATGPAVWLGNVSYGFYLWHWPVLLLFADLRPFYPWLTSLLALALTCVLAAVSYYWIEQPLRTSRELLLRPGAVIVASLVVMLSAIVLVNRGMGNHLGDWGAEVRKIQQAAAVMPRPYLDGCDDWYDSAELEPCLYGNRDSEHTVVLLGDSIGLQWFAAVEAIFAQRGSRLVVLTKSACPMVDRSYYYAAIRSEFALCDQWRKRAVEYLTRLQPDLVIVGSAADYPFSAEDWQAGSASILGRVAAYAGQVIVVAPTPQLAFNGPWCLARRERLGQLLPLEPGDGCHSPASQPAGLGGLEAATALHDNVHWVDMADDVCPGGTCSARRGDHVTYRDRAHLTDEYVMSLRAALAARLVGGARD